MFYPEADMAMTSREEMTMAWWRRIFRLRKGELPHYIDLWMRELVDEGMDPETARKEALRCFGHVEGCKAAPGQPAKRVARVEPTRALML